MIDNNDKRWQKIFSFLLEIGAGNLALSLPTRELEDNLDYLSGSLNMLTEELSTVIHRINPDNSYLHPIVLTFTIDENLKITNIGLITTSILKYASIELNHKPIYNLIPLEMHDKFRKEFLHFRNSDGKTSPSFEVDFETSERLLIKVNCQFEILGDLQNNPSYLVLGTRTVSRNEIWEKSLHPKAISNLRKRKYPTKTRVKLHKDRLDTLNKLHDYIIARLDSPLPKMDEISSEIGASKSKLKKAFKKSYGMGIYTYHRERRLKKAVMLLRKTEKTVETISRECGFVNRSHFSTVFKDRYGYRPTDLRKS